MILIQNATFGFILIFFVRNLPNKQPSINQSPRTPVCPGEFDILFKQN